MSLSLIEGDRKNPNPSSITTLLRFSFRTWCRFLLGCRTVTDSLWEFLASRFTVPLLECFVRNLSLHQKLGELAPLSFALKRHYGYQHPMGTSDRKEESRASIKHATRGSATQSTGDVRIILGSEPLRWPALLLPAKNTRNSAPSISYSPTNSFPFTSTFTGRLAAIPNNPVVFTEGSGGHLSSTAFNSAQ